MTDPSLSRDQEELERRLLETIRRLVAEEGSLDNDSRFATISRRLRTLFGDAGTTSHDGTATAGAATAGAATAGAATEVLGMSRPRRILCLGPAGSFTHLAALEHFRHLGEKAQFELVDDDMAMIQGLREGRGDFGVLAVSNSLTGPLGQNLDLLCDQLAVDRCLRDNSSPLIACGERLLRIEHCLVGRVDDVRQVRRIHTHDRGREQCLRNLTRLRADLGVDLQVIVERSSSEAARKVAEDESGAACAIAHRLAAEFFRLNILREGFEDDANNYTRFLILGRESCARTGRDRTAIWLRLRDEKGSLVEALELIRGYNMTELVSRPLRSDRWAHSFYIEFEGHIQDPGVLRALEQMRRRFKPGPMLVGSFPRCRQDLDGPAERAYGVAAGVAHRRCDAPRIAPPLPVGVRTPLAIGIVGVLGRYGAWLQRYFRALGYQVEGSDIRDPQLPANEAVVRDADVVIFAVPLSEARRVILDCVPFSRADQLWMDIASVKEGSIQAMLKSQAEVVGLHPMCAPPEDDSWKGQTVVLCPARSLRWLDWAKSMIACGGGKVVFRGVQAHDTQMAVLQALPHAMYLAVASVLRRLRIDLDEILAASTPTFSMLWYGLNRYLSNSVDTCADIQLDNRENTLEVLGELLDAVGEMRSWAQGDDRQRLIDELSACRDFVGAERRREAAQRFAEFVRINADFEDRNCIVLAKPEGDHPGLLKEAVDIFADHGLNMTSLHSIPDCDGTAAAHGGGHRFRIGTAESRGSEKVQRVIEELERKGWSTQRV